MSDGDFVPFVKTWRCSACGRQEESAQVPAYWYSLKRSQGRIAELIERLGVACSAECMGQIVDRLIRSDRAAWAVWKRRQGDQQ